MITLSSLNEKIFLLKSSEAFQNPIINRLVIYSRAYPIIYKLAIVPHSVSFSIFYTIYSIFVLIISMNGVGKDKFQSR